MADAKTALMVRTRSDDETYVTFQWAEAVKECFLANGWRICDFAIDDAIRTKVEDALNEGKSSVFIFYGHGLPAEMLSQYVISVIDHNNLNLLTDHIVYAVACWTSKTLGKASEGVVRCYLGYKDRVFVWLDEPYAEHLGRCVNKGIRAMLKTPGCTIEDAKEHIIAEYNYWIDYYVLGDGASGSESFRFASILRHNRDALSLTGAKTAAL